MSHLLDVETWRAVLVASMSELGSRLAAFLPSFLGMLVILAVGWLVSLSLAALLRRFLHRVGLDAAAERLGLTDILRRAGVSSSPSSIVGKLVFWTVMLTFILSAAETLGLDSVTGTIDRLILYLPNVISAALIITIGLLLGRFAGNVVGSAAATARVAYSRQLGAAAQGAVGVMAAVLSLEQLGIDTQILLSVVTTAVATVGLALGLSFALGSRDVVRGILASHYLRQTLVEGEVVEVDGRRGRVERIGPVSTLFRDGDRSWSVPNARLLDGIITR